MDVIHHMSVLRAACVAVRGEAYCTETVVQALSAVSRHETGFGEYKPFARPATSTEPAWHSENKGAMQCGKIADKDGHCPENCFPARDTSPTTAGTSVSYMACFQSYDDEAAGAFAFASLMTQRRPGIAAALPSGNCQTIAEAMHAASYFEGQGATVDERIAGYAGAVCRNASQNARDAKVENFLHLDPPAPPVALPDVGAIFGALLFTFAFVVHRLTRPQAPTP